ncbi:uncharacterized protein LOC110739013 isoform X2 [Chenopodium quinoa]|uniref:uncharacterized protein LOC110739013 isoform X2 n=1 Tax=Chenopodium quinoa TaxID=63459 RepID=UPI000B78CAED|nr:uncharacterized protein LOC110739013 isoform X2 [Chenopodium quinoa]
MKLDHFSLVQGDRPSCPGWDGTVSAFRHRTTSDVPGDILQDPLMGSSSANVQATEVKHEVFNEFDDALDNVMLKGRRKMFYEFDDALDNVTLKERRKLLRSRKVMQSSTSNMEGGSHTSFIQSIVL